MASSPKNRPRAETCLQVSAIQAGPLLGGGGGLYCTQAGKVEVRVSGYNRPLRGLLAIRLFGSREAPCPCSRFRQ